MLDEDGWRPLRAICDHDEALMHLQRGGAEGEERAQPLLDAARKQFSALGMDAWLAKADASVAAARLVA